jgi:hypothetical protein
MKHDLEPIKNALHAFLKDIEEVKALRKHMTPPMSAESLSIKDKEPIFDASKINPAQDSYWEKEDA